MECESNETISFLDDVLETFSKGEKLEETVGDVVVSTKKFPRRHINATVQTGMVPTCSRHTQAECCTRSTSTQISARTLSKLIQTENNYEEIFRVVELFEEENANKICALDNELASKITRIMKTLDFFYQKIRFISSVIKKQKSTYFQRKISLSFSFLFLKELETRQKIELNQIEEKYKLQRSYFSEFRTSRRMCSSITSVNLENSNLLSIDSLLTECKAILNE